MWNSNVFPTPMDWGNQNFPNAQQYYQQQAAQYQANFEPQFPMTQGQMITQGSHCFPAKNEMFQYRQQMMGQPGQSDYMMALQAAYNKGREDERMLQEAQRHFRYQQFLQQMQMQTQGSQYPDGKQYPQNQTYSAQATQQYQQQLPFGQQGIPGYPPHPTQTSTRNLNPSTGVPHLIGEKEEDSTNDMPTLSPYGSPVAGQNGENEEKLQDTLADVPAPEVVDSQVADQSRAKKSEDEKPGLMDFVPRRTVETIEKEQLSELQSQIDELDQKKDRDESIKIIKAASLIVQPLIPSSSCDTPTVCSAIPSTSSADCPIASPEVPDVNNKNEANVPPEMPAFSECNQETVAEPMDEESAKKIAEIYNRLIAPLDIPPRKELHERNSEEEQQTEPVKSRFVPSRPRFHVAVHFPRFERLSVQRTEWGKYCLTCLAHGTIKFHHGINERCFFKGCSCSPYGCQWPKSRLQDAIDGWDQEQEDAKKSREAQKEAQKNIMELPEETPSNSSNRSMPGPQIHMGEGVVYKQNCGRCKVHGHLIPKKGHRNCPFGACKCSQCAGIEKRNEYFRKRSAQHEAREDS